MTATKARSAAERLTQARAAVSRLEKKIDDALEHRRETLRRDDANSPAAIRADEEIVALRALRQRLIDQIPLLGPVVAQEQQHDWPSNLPDARAALLELEPKLAKMEAVPKFDRSAALDAQTDFLRKRQYSLIRLIESFPAEGRSA